MKIADVITKMIVESNGNRRDISHFLKVYAYAKTIGEAEGLDKKTQEILEVAAVIHDIACPLCREKYGSVAGPLQEAEGMILAKTFLLAFDVDEAFAKRVIYLVGHHHTLDEINGLDYQILIEADYLVNADESAYPEADIHEMMEQIFKTKTGTELLRSMYLAK